MKNKLISKLFCLLVSLVLIFGVNSCGTILYPERRGQTTGKIDVGVVLLDGLGLLLFVVPGIIAFAVDFSTGAIYLPPESPESSGPEYDKIQDMEMTRIGREALTQNRIQSLIARRTGHTVDLTSPGVKVTHFSNGQEPNWQSLSEVLTPNQLELFKNGEKRL
ncbi:MAG: polyribonucleotide nucleotidyltransferase [Planctomycetota bacterium]